MSRHPQDEAIDYESMTSAEIAMLIADKLASSGDTAAALLPFRLHAILAKHVDERSLHLAYTDFAEKNTFDPA